MNTCKFISKNQLTNKYCNPAPQHTNSQGLKESIVVIIYLTTQCFFKILSLCIFLLLFSFYLFSICSAESINSLPQRIVEAYFMRKNEAIQN